MILPVRKQNNIEVNNIAGVTHYFHVKKGKHDILIVYNNTSCGLNKSVRMAHLGISTVRYTSRALLAGYFQCDNVLGKYFLIFFLHKSMNQLQGVDVHYVRSPDTTDEEWKR